MKRNVIIMLDEDREQIAAAGSPAAGTFRRGPRPVDSTEEGLTCRECGTIVDKLYQNDTCKPCLIKSFSKCIEVINVYRDPRGGRQAKV